MLGGNLRKFVRDAQPLAFLISQTASVEAGVDPVDHSQIQYPDLMYVDTTAMDWASTITYFSMDMTGQAEWFNAAATDMPFADTERGKHDVAVHMAAIGYQYNLEEIMQAQMVPNVSLPSDRASAARESANRFVEVVAKTGDTTKTWTGLYNNTTVGNTAVTTAWVVAATGNLQTGKQTSDILHEINAALTLVFGETEMSYIADTFLVPPKVYAFLAGTPRATGSDQSLLDWVKASNVYTASTNQPLMLKSGIGLDNQASGRAIAYLNQPKVVRLHYPMVHQFMDPREVGAGIAFAVPGIMRLGGTEVKRARGMRYVSNLLA
jgi:hypothetical protein